MAPTKDLIFYGTATLSTTGALTVPTAARKELGMPGGSTVFVFGSKGEGQAILAASPDAGDLLDALSVANRKSRSVKVKKRQQKPRPRPR